MKKILLLSLMLMSFLGFAQVTTSSIKGLILDETGQPLPGANILAIHKPTGTKYGDASNFEGRYSMLNMRVGGPYIITISYIGFKDKVFSDVYLTLGKTENIDYKMIPDSEELDAILLTGSSNGTFGSDRTGAETSIGRREITRLPTITRSAADFTRLEPSSTGNSFGGRNDQYNNFSLDGSIFNNPFGLDSPTPGGQSEAQPISLDAIDQIQVSLAPYDVTQSGFTGASVNAVTKSGTNQFHGTVYGFTRTEDLTGSKVDGDDVLQPDLEQNQFGFSIGGPIVQNKLFFFANFEKDQRTDLGTNGFFPVPLNGSTGSAGESRVLESDFLLVNNILGQIVVGRDNNGQDIFYNPGAYDGFTFDRNSTKGIFKLDWNINDNNRLAFIYNFLEASREQPAHPSALGFRGPGPNQLQFQNAGYQINNNIDSFQLELNSNLEGGVTNKLQIGYTHFDDFRNPLSTPAPTITLLNEGSNYIIAGHEPFSINNTLDQKVFQFTNNMNYVTGVHNFTIGVSFEKFEFDNSFNLGAYGAQGVFFPTADINSFRDADGDSAAEAALVAFYQGLFDDARAANQSLSSNGVGNPGGWALAETNVGQLAFYLQDQWDITENFKLTYGLRFDRPLYFDTAEKVQENINRKGGDFPDGTYMPNIDYFDPDTGETVNLDSTVMPSSDILFSPRIGFNWDVNGNGATQVRGGSGIFTGRFPFVWLGNQVQGTDFFFYQIVDPDFKWPQVWRTNIGADHRFDGGLLLSADLMYTKDINGAHVQNWGLDTPSGTLGGVDNRPTYLESDKAKNEFGGSTNAYVFTNSDKGRIWNATLKAQKTWGQGFYTSLAYNYLDSKDVNSIEAEITGDAFAGNAISGNANDDVLSYSKYGNKHRFVGVASQKFEYGRDNKWATTISTFFEYARGGRFSYTYGGDINNDGSNFNDLIYIPSREEVGQMQFSGPGQAEAFEQFIRQDDYLSDNRGSYAERYGALSPWRSRWDIKILQDFNFNPGKGNKNTIQLSIDVLNFGNLLNSNWGVVEVPNSIQPLGVTVDENNVPTYTFDGNLTETFSADVSLLSRWQMQVGLRYIF